MKRRKVTALLLAATMAVTGIGQTAMVWGSDFSDEFYGEIASEEIVVEEPQAEVGESDVMEDMFDSEEPTEEFISEDAETGLSFAEGEEGKNQEVEYWYDFPGQKMELLPEWDEWINRYPSWHASNGEEGSIEITNIEVKDEDDPVISYSLNEEESGWDIHANKFGNAEIILTYKPVDSEEEATYTISVCVKEDVYHLSIDSNTGTGNVLPGAELILNANVWVDSAQNQEMAEDKAKEVKVKWAVEEGEDFINHSEDEGGFHVTAKQDASGHWARVAATGSLTEDGEPVCGEVFDIYINDTYYEIMPLDSEVKGDLAVGESVTIEPELYEYTQEQKESPIDGNNFSWRWEWNPDIFEIKDRNNQVLIPEEDGCAYGKAPFTIKKLKNCDDSLKLMAELPGEEESWAAAERWYNFGRIDYDVWFNDGTLRGDDHYTWIFTNEKQTVSLNTDTLKGDYALVWQAGNYVPNENGDYDFCKDSSIPYSISSDGTSITLNGAAIPAGSNFNVRVTVMAGGDEVGGTDFWVDVKEPRYDYGELPYFYEGSTEQLPYWDFGINKEVNCYVEDAAYPEGEGLPVSVTSVAAENAADDEGYGSVVTVEPWENENGWNVHMNRMGHAIVTVDYTTWDGKNASYTIDVYVGGDVYDMSISSDTATNKMLPGKSITLTADVYQRSFDWEKGHSDITNPEDVWIEWEYDSESDIYTFTPNGNQLTVKAEKDGSGTDVRAVAYVRDENGNPAEVASCDWGVEVFLQYYTISEDTLESGKLWGCSQKIELNPELTLFSEENMAGTTVKEPIRYRVEGDTRAFAFVGADGKEEEITDDNRYVEAPFTVVRKTTDGFNVSLVAELYDEAGNPYEVERRDFWMDGLDYNVWFSEEGTEELRGGGDYTWIYSDEKGYHVSLITKNLEGYDGYDIEWCLDEALSGAYRIDEDKKGITFDGTKLNGIVREDPFNGGFDVEVIVRAGGEEVSRNGFRADIRDPYCVFDEIQDGDVLVGDSMTFDGNVIHYYEETKENPKGASYELVITNIAVDNSDESNPAYVAEQLDDGTWRIEARNYGEARLTITAATADGHRTVALNITKHVSSDIYRTYMSVESNGVMLPGTSVVMKPHVLHFEEGQEAPKELEPGEYSIELGEYDTNWFTVTADEETHDITVQAKDTWESVQNYIWANIKIPVGDDDEYRTDAGITFWIRPEYVQVEGAESFITEPGATVTAEDMGAVLKVYNKKNPDGKVVEDASFTFDILDGNKYLDVNEAKNAIIVKEGVLSTDDDPEMGYVEICYIDEETEDLPSNYWGVPVTICNHKGTIVTPGTCTSNGSIVINCPKCGKKETKVFYGGGHTLTHHSAVSATCTSSGTIEYWSCSSCGKTFSDAAGTRPATNLTTSALGHTGGTATCTEQAKCTRCGATYGEKLPHTIVTVVDTEPTCGTPGRQHSECSVCHGGKTEPTDIPATGEHTFGEWVTISDATVSAAEVQKRTCSVCGYEETKALGEQIKPVLGIPGKLSSFSILKGETVSFAVTMAKGDALASCTSSKKSAVKVAAVDKETGTISLKAVKSGTANITITLASGMSKTFTAKVTTGTIKTSKIALSTKEATLAVGKYLRLNATLKPFTSTQKVTYTSSDKSVATVSSSGKVKAIAPGVATITAVSGSKKATCKVTVAGITNVKSSVTVKKGKTYTLKPALYGISDKITYTTSNKKVATVSSKGKIKGIKKGTATITITAGKYTVKCKVKVQ